MENPTQEGASIQERIETFLEEPQSAPTEEVEEVQAQEVEQETPEGDDSEAESEPSLQLSDLAKYFGVDENLLDVDENGEVSFKTKIDGQEGKTKLQDALTSYQLKGHLDNKIRAHAETEKQWQAQVAEYQNALQERYQYAEDLASAAQAELNRNYQGIDWNSLRANDPGQYAALLQDYQVQQANINNIAQNAKQQREHFENQQLQIGMERLQQNLSFAEQEIVNSFPEWKDQGKRQQELGEVVSYMQNDLKIPANVPVKIDGVNFSNVYEAIHNGAFGSAPVIAFRKAMLYDRMQASKASVENKVRTAPKLVKPGQTAPSGQDQQVRNLKANIKKTGGKNGSVADYLIATGKV